MTLPLNLIIADDVAWIAVLGLLAIYIYRSAKASGQYDKHCPICKLDVRKIKQNNDRYFRLTAHDKFTWRNPLAFYQTYYFDSLDHLKMWIDFRMTISEVIDKPTIALPTDEELDRLGSKEPLSDN